MKIVDGFYEMQYIGPWGKKNLNVSLKKRIFTGEKDGHSFVGTIREQDGNIIGNLCVTGPQMKKIGVEGKLVLLQAIIEMDGKIKLHERDKLPSPDQTLVLLTPM